MGLSDKNALKDCGAAGGGGGGALMSCTSCPSAQQPFLFSGSFESLNKMTTVDR